MWWNSEEDKEKYGDIYCKKCSRTLSFGDCPDCNRPMTEYEKLWKKNTWGI